MSSLPNAAAAGTITIGGDLPIHRLGYGAMRVTGPGVIGLPHDLASSRATLRELPTLGVNFVETSIAYGPLISEMLVREALHPYEGITIATNGGLERPGPSQWASNAKPENLRAHVEGSLKLLGIERIDLWQLHRIDRDVPLGDRSGALSRDRSAQGASSRTLRARRDPLSRTSHSRRVHSPLSTRSSGRSRKRSESLQGRPR